MRKHTFFYAASAAILMLAVGHANAQQTADQTPNATVRGAGLVPGAVVCADYQAVAYIFRRLSETSSEIALYRATNGQSAAIQSIRPPPDLDAAGCVFLDTGTRVSVKMSNGIPIVTALTKDGLVIGPTLPAMVEADRK